MTGLDFGDFTLSDVTNTINEISFTLDVAQMPMVKLIFEARRGSDGHGVQGTLSNPALAEWQLDIELRRDENTQRAPQRAAHHHRPGARRSRWIRRK